ncbi:5-oxoprolinase-like protein, partial [Tanacetum coccineum]
ERCVWIDLVGLPLASWAPEVYKKLGGRWGSSVFTDMVSDGPMSHGKVCVLTESLHRVIESFIVSYRNRTYRIIATEFAYWAPNIESMEVNSESNPLERKDAEGPSLDESLENEEHLDVDSCDSDSPKNVNNDSVSPSSRVLREEDVRGVESDLVDSFEEGEIRDDSVLYNDGCIKDCMEKNLEDDAGEILGVHSQGDCGNVTTDDNEDVTPVIAPEKDSIIAPPSTPPGNDLNIAAESGSSWIDYIGPLTSDEIDSDKRWSYRDPNGNIHGLFSLAQLRSWKDYFPSDLQIWSYYGNVKEAILLHNALSRQTKDAVWELSGFFVRLSEPKKKILDEKGIDCIFIEYAEHSKAYRFYVIEPNDSVSVNSVIESRDAIFDENRFSSIPKPKDIVSSSNGTQGGDLPGETPIEIHEPRRSNRACVAKSYGSNFQLYLVKGSRDEIASQYSYCYSIEEDPKTFDEAMKSRDVAFWK